MPISVYEAQQNIRRTGQLWTRGQYDSNVCILVTVLNDGSFVATAETEHINEHQFRSALEKVYGTTHNIKVERQGWARMGGYWRAEGTLKDSLTGPNATWEDLGRGFVEKEPDWEPRPEADEGSAAVNPEIKRDYPDYGGHYQ